MVFFLNKKRKRLHNIYDRMTFQGRLAEKGQEKVAQTLIGLSTNLGKVSWEELQKKGFARFTGLGGHPGIGWKQILGMIAGAGLAVMGVGDLRR